MNMQQKQEDLCAASQWDFSGISTLFLNCTLKPSFKQSNTGGLMEVSQVIMEKVGVATEMLRPVDYDLAPGVYPNMTEHGFDRDDWPELLEKILNADILVIGSPI
jgi:multimeric flavodoxin WrbA